MSRVLRIAAAAAVLAVWPAAAPAQDGFSHVGDPRIHCDDCHNLHGGALIPTGLDQQVACESCHNPTGMASGKTEVGLHSIGGSQTIDCGKCHDPHTLTAPNADDIRLQLRYATAGTPVDYPDVTPRRFIAGATPFDGVCEVCHTQTAYHRGNTSGDHLHNLLLDCSSCHTHSAGFSPSCTGCHSQPQGSRRAVVASGGDPNDFGNTSHHVLGNVEDTDCLVCHEMSQHQAGQVRLLDPDLGSQHVYVYSPALPQELEPFCLNCRDADGAAAGGGLTPFSDGETVPDVIGEPGSRWDASAHGTEPYWRNNGNRLTCFGDGEISGCHGNGHGSPNEKLMAGPAGSSVGDLCTRCHTDGMLANEALSGPGLADDIAQAFGLGERHDLGTSFGLQGRSYVLECSTCHNPHVVTGKHWEVEQDVSPVTRPDLAADPATNPRAVGRELWGSIPGEKMDDFAARGNGSGGWYRKVAEGVNEGSTGLTLNRPAKYQPPKKGSDWDWEFGGDVLPDYTTLCLDCHSEKMSESAYPVNWGQGIPWNYNGSPNTWVTAHAPHGLDVAGQPHFGTDPGWWGNNGNPDPIFLQDWVTRGRGFGHFMRWPYDSAFRNTGINFVLSCTDCHEAHGSNVGSMLRNDPNDGSGSTIWNTMCNNCHYYYGGQHAGMSCGNASCHEVNSIHRIKKNGEYSGGTYLWQSPSQPATTPMILRVEGSAGSDQLEVEFDVPVWGDRFWTSALQADDFVLTDVHGDNPKTILSVLHASGADLAILTLSAPLIEADLGVDLLAMDGLRAWDAEGEPAGPWPTPIPTCVSDPAIFELDEAAGSPEIHDAAGYHRGIVNDPVDALPGDGLLHGDGADNYVLLSDDPRCFQARDTMTVELRVRPDTMASGAANTVQRLFARDTGGNYQLSLWRIVDGQFAGLYTPPDGVGSFAFWLAPVDDHGGNAWKVLLTDYDRFPVVAGHWYRVRVVWNSAKATGLPGDLFVDDQGTDGFGAGENWAGFVNATRSDQAYTPAVSQVWNGDRIKVASGNTAFGVNVNNQANNLLTGLLDRIVWKSVADYGGTY